MIVALGKTAMTGGSLLTGMSLLCLLIVRPGTAQFVLTIASLAMGLVLIGLAIVMVRCGVRPTRSKEDS
ncbi:hypothetical protein FHX74_002998 [Friedmanniella endophytica]|uniref:Uncharacterized protein n=1 Tax=Microlunatus kandeliicorticis TaxID=1759536 RepID=A0A7W3IU79_9ACTN|nr:hypothetical protein [Microlunatus kandeliicorticis]MBA8795362.1 hypothetical protein [Microlunatus kandeliicorticis]